LAQRAGRIGLGFFTRKDGWIHALPGIGAKWTQTRDLRGLPEQTFHEWWEKDREQGNKGPSHPSGHESPAGGLGREPGNNGTEGQ
jgi:hypothetical protein